MKGIIKNLGTVFKNYQPKFHYLTPKGFEEGSFALCKNNGSKTEQIKEAVKEMLLHKDLVKEIFLDYEQLDHEAAEILADFLATNPPLETLILQENKIGDKGAKAISQGLKTNKNLRSINLTNNFIGYDGAKNIAEMLCVNKGLKKIYLAEDNISYNCNSEFIEAIKQNTSLEEAVLPFDQDREYGNHNLLDKIIKNTLPEYDDELDKTIKNALAANARLKFIILANEIHSKTIKNDNPRHLNDAIRDYSAILAARMIREINSYDSHHNFVDTLSNIETRAIQETDEILMNGLTNAEMLAFSKQWHSPFHQITSQKVRDYDGAKWPALFGEKEIEIPSFVTGESGWKLITLTNPVELKLEGQNLQHCVGSYNSQCFRGDSHIVSVVNNKGDAVSTIEFALKQDGSLITKQHYGKNNAEPSLKSKKARKWICEEIKSGNRKIDHKGLKIAHEEIAAEKKQYPFIDQLGFNPLDDNKFSELIRVYKRQMLPAGKFEIPNLTKNFRENFLGKMELSFDPGMALYDFGNIRKIILDSLVEKTKTTVESKIKSGIQGSTNKICGKDVVKVSVINNQIFFSTKNLEALEKIKKIFEEKFSEEDDGILIKGDLNAQSVREIMTRKALEVRKEKRQALHDKPNTIVQNPSLTNDVENNTRVVS